MDSRLLGDIRAELASGDNLAAIQTKLRERLEETRAQADDLARACVRALWRAPVQRVFNCCDDTELTMGDYFELAADLYGLPRPERVSREQARERLSPMTLSFMGESRRLSNLRMKRELGLKLRYPQVEQGLRAA